jgi:hypothetical protein
MAKRRAPRARFDPETVRRLDQIGPHEIVTDPGSGDRLGCRRGARNVLGCGGQPMGVDTIMLNGRAVEVPATPISTQVTFSSLLRPRIRVDGDRMTLELDRGMRPFGLLLLAWGLAAGAVGVLAAIQRWDRVAMLVFLGQGAFLPLVGLLFVVLPARHEFDRAGGVYRCRSVLAPARRALAEIVAVQAIAGRVSEDSDGLKRQPYELNLVVAGVRRLPVTCTTDEEWVAEAGRAVSEFLGVPFLCRLSA